MKKPKLHVYILEQRSTVKGRPYLQSMWCLCNPDGTIASAFPGDSKAEAVSMSARRLAYLSAWFGQHSELRIRNKNGQFAPARTYSRNSDPKRSKG